MPLTNLEVLTILKVEFENLEEIYRVIVLVIPSITLKLKLYLPLVNILL
jgi:hypothetical protein